MVPGAAVAGDGRARAFAEHFLEVVQLADLLGQRFHRLVRQRVGQEDAPGSI